MRVFRHLAVPAVFALCLTAACNLRAQDQPYPPTNGADPFSSGGAPKQQGEQPYQINVNARMVVLDVVVKDKKGNLVRRSDLKKDDFTIYEDGQEQKIRSFEAPDLHVMPAGADTTPVVNSAADLKKIGAAPVTVLVLDELNSRFEDMSYSRNSLVNYLQAQPAVLREPTVLMVAMNRTFQQLHDYTQDRDALIQVVKKHMPEYPWRMMNSGKSGPGAVERMAQVSAALLQIAQASTGTPGRKNLIWVGNGFPASDLTSLDDKTQDTIETLIKRVTSSLLAARVTMYTINPAPGVSSTVDIESPDDLATSVDENGYDPFNSGKTSFETFATSTGGFAFRGRNDINNVIRESIAQGDFYYTLSYAPTGSSQDAAKYRRIRIVMKDPNLRATTRDGYYPDAAEATNAAIDKTTTAKQQRTNLQLDLSGALGSTISYNGLDVKAEKAGDGTYHVLVADAGLTWTQKTDGSETAEATVAAGWYDAKNKLIGHVAREELAPRDGARRGAVYTLPITLPPNAVRLRLLARDAVSGKMGTVDITKF